MDTVNTEMLRGRVDVFVLNALCEKDGYGYDILNYIHSKTSGHYDMKQSSIYSVLKRLEKQGFILSYEGGDETNGAKRRYYRLTDFGREFLENEKKEWEYTRTLLNNLVSDNDFNLKTDTPPFRPSELRPLTRRSTQQYTVNDTTISEENQEDVQLSNVCDDVVLSPESMIVSSNTENVEEKTALNEYKQTAKHEKQDLVTEPVGNDTHVENMNNTTDAHLELLHSNNRNSNNYKEVLSGILNAKTIQSAETKSTSYEDIDCKYIYDMKAILNKEGHKLKEYSPSIGKSYIKYIYVNRLVKDSVILSFLFYVVMLLIVALCRKVFSVELTSLLIIGGLSLVIPIVTLFYFFKAPNGRKKDTLKPKLVMSISFIVYFTAFMLNLIISLLIPNGFSLNSAHIYAPCIILLCIPFFGVIFYLLHKSNKYHQKQI